jgi:SAM-dependent methyltransferase
VSVPWRCPRCRGALADAGASIHCAACGAHYDVVDGIPDLRVPTLAWVDFDRDKAEARKLASLAGAGAEALARAVFGARPHWNEARVCFRTQQVLEGPARAAREIETWLAPAARASGPLLEIGCGTGGLLAALPADREAIGVDVSLAWLVVAKRLLAEHGRSVPLAAAVAEALPLADGSAGAVVALDVIEHVADLGPVLREIDRVAAPGAALAFSTPNRFSLGAEPHVGVWGVGWLPRRLQPGYVQWRTGEPYTFARLLSAREALRLIRAHTRFEAAAEAPPIPDEELARFGSRRAALARAYNALTRAPGIRAACTAVGPFFRVTGRRRT